MKTLPSCTLLALYLVFHWVSVYGTTHVLCPPANEAITEGSPCQPECYEDRQCQTASGSNMTLCCPTSSDCGQQCVTGINVHRHPPVLACPDISSDTVGACYENCNPTDDGCPNNEMCCSNGCGHDCVAAVQVTPVCQGIMESRNGTFRVGEYIPQCDTDGNFLPAQCHGSTGYCWCVEPQTGRPVGSRVTHFEQPECNSCFYKGKLYYPGDSFSDDCNTCFCSEDASVGCTEIGCNPEPIDASPFFSCPVIEDDVVGICASSCNSDSDCDADQKCCVNGCGAHNCMTPVTIPHVAPTRECPEEQEPVICDAQECTDSCDDPQKLCCQNSCGSRLCVDGELPSFPCTNTVNSLTGGALLGQYVPQCNVEDGTFRLLQCWENYCWCVDSMTGEPTSDMKQSERVSELECGCYFEGHTVLNGEVAKYYEGCNKTKCLDGELVMTDTCDPEPIDASPFLSCPVIEDNVAGICASTCDSDSDCDADQKCCVNSCGGSSCVTPVTIPHVAPTRECPEEYEEVICDLQECTNSCDDPRKLCCSNICGSRLCVDGELPSFPCTKTVNSLTGGALLGQYVPRCNVEDGTFRLLQCWENYCWCVDSMTGEPTSDMKQSERVSELECGCYFEGHTVLNGEVAKYYGGCNKTKCLDGELVTTDTCDPCEYDGVTLEHGEDTGEDCGACSCLDGVMACPFANCGTDIDIVVTHDLEWWHGLLIAAGILIGVLAVIAGGLLTVAVMMFRLRHKRVQDSSDMLSFDNDAQVLFKNGPLDSESVELKVPMEDDKDPVDT